MFRSVSLALSAMFLLSAGCAGIQERRFIAGVKDKPARDFELDDLSGQPVKLSSFRGRPVVLAFFAHG